VSARRRDSHPKANADAVRRIVATLVGACLIAGAPAASAGPICENRAGEAVRCEDPRAMPLGWTPSLEERLTHPDPGPPEPTAVELGGVFALILVIFALIALMPDFDGWAPGRSDRKGDAGNEQD
jgi:hypothetical protein